MNELFVRSVDVKSGDVPPSHLRSVFPILFNKNITIIVGENGSGKSTLLESIAIKLGCNPEGGGKNFCFKTEDTHSTLHKKICISKGYKKEKDIFFYRAESFYNVTTEIRKLDAVGSFDPEIKSYYGGRDLHQMSHGEAMESLYSHRFNAKGLYILDEPEAALSPQRQLNFIAHICKLADLGAQFIIATHSPIIIFTPGCELLSLEDGALTSIDADRTDLFVLYKSVINSSGEYLKKVLVE